ncbi:ECF RNA polymerase sigma factor SigK [Metallococcus carri]|uniref:ECF RNA polymerase sigma factor SigK n=1 Tax=Metallococcus carri TaxID=1656884 RepID=UPI002E27DE58|nr:ECF RNA polymerase sigma factor SigK [Metallococcus carri]
MDDSSGRPVAPDRLGGLITACSRGDDRSFAELYDVTAPRVFGLVLRVVRDHAQAEEVTQEVYLAVWRTAASFDPAKGSALSWLMTIAHRRAVDRVRSAQAQTDRDTAYGLRDRDRDYDVTAEDAHRSMDAERVRKALATLTPSQAEAIELAYFGGYTHREVAALLKLPVGTAKTRIRDGLIRLRDAWGVER